jgi:DNA-binding MarR family transcriptional regulator
MTIALQPTLGTELRGLLELLDGDLEELYSSQGLRYRPRYTPVVRVLEAIGSASIKTISQQSGLSHSAASQTVAQMTKVGLIQIVAGNDGRERILKATDLLISIMPKLHELWRKTNCAAQELDDELSASLLATVREAIVALKQRSFSQRIASQT